MSATAADPTGDRVELFGVEVDALTMSQTLDRAFELADEPSPSQHVVLNASKVVQLEDDDWLRGIISSCDIVTADGASVVWASKILGRPLPERVTGIDLFTEIVGRSAETGHSVYFLGARDEVLDEMMRRFLEQYPTLHIAGHRNGYWSEDEEADVVADVRASNADFLFVAIPSPRKEYFLREHLEELGVPFVMGVGGSFDVIAGLVKRAPTWAQKSGLEWAYRLGQEPRRMWKRYLVGNTKFVVLVARAWARQRR